MWLRSTLYGGLVISATSIGFDWSTLFELITSGSEVLNDYIDASLCGVILYCTVGLQKYPAFRLPL